MLRKSVATSMVEYVVLITLIVGLVGAAMVAVISTIWTKLSNVTTQIGS
jgi:Flp pilus assembly pilin Flp